METMKIYLDPHGARPTRAHVTDAGLDIYSPKSISIHPGEMVVINTGVHVQLPDHTVGFVKSRSSMFNRGILTDGTIDEGYTGEIKVMLYNFDKITRYIQAGTRIAQLVICDIHRPALDISEKPLDETDRGDSGFGGSGR